MSTQQATTPTETAEIIDITPVSLRRWCDYHAAHLSPGANPPAGQARRFTGRDIEVLKTVKQLRGQGFTVARINEQLATLTFAEIDTSEQAENAVALTPTSPESHTALILPSMALDDLERRIDAKIEALRLSATDARQNQRDYVQGVAVGAIGALVFVMFLLLLFLVRHWL